MRYIVLMMSMFVLMACQNEKSDSSKTNKVIIAGKILNFSKGEFLIHNWDQREKLSLSENGDFILKLNQEDSKYLNFQFNRFNFQFFCEPGDSLYFIYDVKEKNRFKAIHFSGDRTLENSYLINKLGIINGSETTSTYQTRFLKDLTVSDEVFLAELILLKEKLDNELASFKKKSVSADFIKYEKFANHAEIVAKISARIYNKRMAFIPLLKDQRDREGKILISEVDTTTTKELTRFVEELNLNDKELYNLNKREYIRHVNKAINFYPIDYGLEIFKDDFAKPDINHLNKVNTKAEKYLKDSSVLEGYYYTLIDGSLNWKKTDIAKAFLNKINNKKWLQTFEVKIQKQEEAKRGKVVDFPDFQANLPTDEVFTKSQLLGRYTYIDFWATWCGPCKREIPSLKELEKEYHDKNINFVSISIDSEKDYGKWKKMVKDLELTGIQIHVSEENYNPIKDLFKINSIPRFVLLGPDGKSIQIDAPRPSSLDIRPLLNSILEE